MEKTIIREGYVKVGKIVGRNMKRKYLRLKCASGRTTLAQIEYFDDEKQATKKSTPNKVIPMRLVAAVHKIETNSPLKSPSLIPYHIKLELIKDKERTHDVYFELDVKENFDDWVCDLEFLVRLPELKIPISMIPLYDCRSPFDLSIVERGQFEDACPVYIIRRELGESSKFEQPNVILALRKNVVLFLDMQTGGQLLAYDIQFLRRCGNWQQLIFIEAGRKSVTGEGYLWMYVESAVLAKSIYASLSSIMGSGGNKRMERNLSWNQYCSGVFRCQGSASKREFAHNSLPPLPSLQEPLYQNYDVRRHHSLTDGSQNASDFTEHECKRLSSEGVFFSDLSVLPSARSSALTERSSYTSCSSVLTQETSVSISSDMSSICEGTATLDRKKFRFRRKKSGPSKIKSYFKVGNSTFYKRDSLANAILDSPLPSTAPLYQTPSNISIGPPLYQTLPSNRPRVDLFSEQQYNLYKLVSNNQQVDFSQRRDLYDHLELSGSSGEHADTKTTSDPSLSRFRAKTWPEVQGTECSPEAPYMKMQSTTPLPRNCPFSYISGVSAKEQQLRNMSTQISPRVTDFLSRIGSNQISESNAVYEVMSHPGSLSDDVISQSDSKRSSLNSTHSQPVFHSPDYMNQDFLIQPSHAPAYLQALSAKDSTSGIQKKLHYITLNHEDAPHASSAGSAVCASEMRTEYDLIDHMASRVLHETCTHHRNNNNNSCREGKK